MSEKTISDDLIRKYLKLCGFNKKSCDEGRLILLELLAKSGAGYYNSHTQDMFLHNFNITKKDGSPNRRGMRFMSEMLCADDNCRPLAFVLMSMYRN